MDSKIEFKIKLILNDLSELEEREEELTQNENLLVMYSYDWINSLSRLGNIWNSINDQQRESIIQKYEEVKPIAMKLELPWPEELA
jgi:hypothetical protein